jgi:hypothetical protein
MLRRTPLRAKGKHKPAAIKRHHDRVAALGCLVCGGPATLHHVSGYADKAGRFSRDDWLVVPLAPQFHLIQHGPHWSVEALGHQGFFRIHGIDLLAEAIRLRDESMAMERRAA